MLAHMFSLCYHWEVSLCIWSCQSKWTNCALLGFRKHRSQRADQKSESIGKRWTQSPLSLPDGRGDQMHGRIVEPLFWRIRAKVAACKCSVKRLWPFEFNAETLLRAIKRVFSEERLNDFKYTLTLGMVATVIYLWQMVLVNIRITLKIWTLLLC